MSDTSTPSDVRATGQTRSRIAGLVLATIGLTFAWYSRDYAFGTLHRTGPGFFPLVTALAVVGLGLAILVFAPPIPGGGDRFAARPFVFITLACVAFTLLIERGGLIPASFAAVLLSTMSESRPSVVGSVSFALIAAITAWAVFSWGLGLPIKAFGGP